MAEVRLLVVLAAFLFVLAVKHRVSQMVLEPFLDGETQTQKLSKFMVFFPYQLSHDCWFKSPH